MIRTTVDTLRLGYCYQEAQMLSDPISCGLRVTLCRHKKENQGCGGVVLRWQRNRMGRPLSPSQIHQKNISMLSKFHKTTSECRQRTSGTQKSSSLSSKTGRKKYKRQKIETKEVVRELSPGKGVLKREKFPNTRKHSHCQVWVSLGSTEGNITGRKNK